MMDVCFAIIISEGKMLAVQKGPNSSHPMKWEFPGGKVNPLESAAQCIVREIEEELLLEMNVVQRLQSIEFNYGNQPFCLIPFVCSISSGEIILTEHVAMQWIEWTIWQSLDWAQADRQLIVKNEQQLKQLLS